MGFPLLAAGEGGLALLAFDCPVSAALHMLTYTGPGMKPVGDVGVQREPLQRGGAVLMFQVLVLQRQHLPLPQK